MEQKENIDSDGQSTIGKVTGSIKDSTDQLKKLGNPQEILSSIKSGKKEFPTISKDYSSLCVLSYERPKFLTGTLASMRESPCHPYELIIHDDGSWDNRVHEELNYQRFENGATVISNAPGHNQGQGVALNRMFSIASGDPIIKLDADLKFHKGWLQEVVRLMRENPQIGLLGLVNYYHDPVDCRKTAIDRYDTWSVHTHILGSAFAVRRQCWEELGPFSEHSDAFAEDWEFQKDVTASDDWVCALPKEDLVTNLGMGIGKSSIVLSETEIKTIYKEPYIVRSANE